MTLQVGQVLAGLEIGPVAHGGHFVARHQGQVVFVRGGLTGELADVQITEVVKKFARGKVVGVQRSSAHRVEPSCPIAQECGGCDFQHVEIGHTRELKRQVIAEQLGHLAGLEFSGEVSEVPPSPLHWRTRMRYHLDEGRRLGLLAHRSKQVVPLPVGGCRLAVESIAFPQIPVDQTSGQVLAVAAASGTLVIGESVSDLTVAEQADGRTYHVWADGFWQAHLGAAQVLIDEVLTGLQPAAGESAVDLYCGAGLFAGALAARGCQVFGVEGNRRAVEMARLNVTEGRFLAGDVNRLIDRLPAAFDLAVLDPPRAGAGAGVLAGLLGRRPRAVAYVACDPSALARDLRTAADLGYDCVSVTALDLFPLTHHVECVAILKPS